MPASVSRHVCRNTELSARTRDARDAAPRCGFFRAVFLAKQIYRPARYCRALEPMGFVACIPSYTRRDRDDALLLRSTRIRAVRVVLGPARIPLAASGTLLARSLEERQDDSGLLNRL